MQIQLSVSVNLRRIRVRMELKLNFIAHIEYAKNEIFYYHHLRSTIEFICLVWPLSPLKLTKMHSKVSNNTFSFSLTTT